MSLDDVVDRLDKLNELMTVLIYLVGLGCGAITWICVLYSKNSSRFW